MRRASRQDRNLLFLIDGDSKRQRNLAAEIYGSFQASRVDVVRLDTICKHNWTNSSATTVVSLLEVGKPRLASLTEDEFNSLQRLIKETQSLLWVTSASMETDRIKAALYAPATGLLRTVRSEDSSKHVVTLAIESCQTDGEARHVLDVFRSCFSNSPDNDSGCIDKEFVVRQGSLMIPRVSEEIMLDKDRESRIIPQTRMEPWKTGPHLSLAVATPGVLDSLHYIEDVAGDTELELTAEEVEIEAVCWPASLRDVSVALGKGGDERLGFESSGYVTRSSSPDFQIGDKVVMIQEGCMRSHPRAPAKNVFRIPGDISLQDSAASILPGLLAYHSLVNIARLRHGDTILIHSAAGATGQMAVGVARMLGAEVYATVGHSHKKQLLVDRFAIPADHIFYSRDTSFANGILRMTSGRGVDCVLNCLPGEALKASFESLAPHGHLVDISKVDIKANSLLAMAGFSNNRTYSGVDILHLVKSDMNMVRKVVQTVLDLVADATSSIVAPYPVNMHSVSDVAKAFQTVKSGESAGRVLITASPSDSVRKFITLKSTWKFEAHATYVIGGGLGGIGRALARWMAARGARNLILLSRSGASSPAARSLLSELREKYNGINIQAPCCDVSSSDSLAAALACTENMPQIRGCINAIMNLQDSIFERMSHAQWSATMKSKLVASWNLHTQLPKGMDFFILLSSLSGIYGAIGQSNYAAGCTFQDALAQARAQSGSYGRCSVSLDLGWMKSVGVIAESDHSAEYLRNREESRDSAAVETEDLIAVLEHFCNPSLPSSEIHSSQMLVGAITPAYFLSRGEQVVAPTLMSNGHLFASFDVASAFSSEGSSKKAVSEEDSVAALFQAAQTSREKGRIVVEAIKAKVARNMAVAAEDIDSAKKPSDYGVDSLMAVQLRNWLQKSFGAAIAVFEMMGGLSITEVGELVVSRAENNVTR